MEQKKKTYTTPPLPFRGNKRNFIREFKEVLSGIKDIDVVVDLFGGSGLLSRAAKDVLPHARVIYNDFDNYTQRLENIERTNEILDLIRPFVEGIKKEQRLPEETKNKIINVLSEQDGRGFVDYITLSSSLLFSGEWATSKNDLSRRKLYNSIRIYPYDSAEGYLDGLEITSKDYIELLEDFKNQEKVLFLLAPPYLQTGMESYSNPEFWTVSKSLDLAKMIIDLNNMGSKFIFFASNNSEQEEVISWLCTNFYEHDIMKDSEIHRRKNHTSKIRSYEDFMYVML